MRKNQPDQINRVVCPFCGEPHPGYVLCEGANEVSDVPHKKAGR